MSYLNVLVDSDYWRRAQPTRYANEAANLEFHCAAVAGRIDGHRFDGDGGYIQCQIEGPIVLSGELLGCEGHKTKALVLGQQSRGVSQGVEAAYEESR